jgi:hypothetical protein
MPTKDPEKRRLSNRRYYDRHKGQERRARSEDPWADFR